MPNQVTVICLERAKKCDDMAKTHVKILKRLLFLIPYKGQFAASGTENQTLIHHAFLKSMHKTGKRTLYINTENRKS
ncbi:hypothetical protein TorRG33x02_183680 [Trema orientale]|uniref:Uncharacterized protein n=1 Tax=Trema orientale TaxID=63057 RepID=A0A2P5EK53_TREOI|nr:hypothetical protein TorRG33x02_183680 [Trema orientale]